MKEGVGRALRRAIGRDDVLSRIKSRKGGVSVLMNSKRRAIFQHLIDNPLTHLREIARDMEIPVGTVSWHLKALTEAKAVDFFKGKRKCLYYPSDWIEKEDISCLSILQSRISRTLYSSLVKTPGLSQTELAGRLRKYQQYIQPRIVDLERCGFLRWKWEGRKKLYFPTDKLTRLEKKYEGESPRYLEKTIQMLEEDGLNPKIGRRGKDIVVVKLDDGRNVFFLSIRRNPIKAIMRE